MLDKLIRYGAVADILGPNPDGTILEVGAGPHGLGCCLPYRFVGVDTWYPDPPLPQNRAVRASGTDLPFADQSFDYVLCIEVLEHLPMNLRSRIVSEMCRVCRKTVIITHPYGRIARAGDHLLGVLYDLLKAFGKARPWWLVEHLQNPYPDPGTYLSGSIDGFHVIRKGQENGILHPGLVFFTNLKVVARRIAKSYARMPGFWRWLVRLIHFPPYSRMMLILEREP